MDFVERAMTWLHKNGLLFADWYDLASNGSVFHVVVVEGPIGPIRVEAPGRREAYRRAIEEVYNRYLLV